MNTLDNGFFPTFWPIVMVNNNNNQLKLKFQNYANGQELLIVQLFIIFTLLLPFLFDDNGSYFFGVSIDVDQQQW